MLVYGHTLQPVCPLAIAERGAESTSALMGHGHSCTLTAVFQAWWRSQGGGASVQGQLGPWTHGTAPGRAQAGDPWRHDSQSMLLLVWSPSRHPWHGMERQPWLVMERKPQHGREAAMVQDGEAATA